MALSLSYGVTPASPRCRARYCKIIVVQASAPSSGDKKRLSESLKGVSSALSSLSLAISSVSSAFQQLAEALSEEPDENSDSEDVQAEVETPNIQEESLPIRLHQSFLQMRVQGLGKPFELAADEFVSLCLEARESNLSLEDLQLQLILSDGALPGSFSIKTDDPQKSYFIREEARIRAVWVRHVYVAASEADRAKNLESGSSESIEEEASDPADAFVKQVINDSADKGYTLTQLKLEQELSGPEVSPSVKMLQQSSFLILLAFEKAMKSKTPP